MLRRSPLARRTPLQARTPLARGKRRINPISQRRRDDIPRRTEVRRQVLERDGHRCQIGPRIRAANLNPAWHRCWGRLEVHELRKANTGEDTYTVDNTITACSFHNTWVEDHPPEARALKLVQR